MAGNAEDPVILDPAQVITEVHWPATFVAFSVEIDAKASTDTREYAGEPFVYEDHTSYRNSWILWVGYWYGSTLRPLYKRQNGAWHFEGSASGGITGLPTLPNDEPGSSSDDGAFAVTPEHYVGEVANVSWEGGGAATTIPVPGHPEQFFEGATSATLAYRTEVFTAALKWTAWPPPPEVIAFLSYSAPAAGSEEVAPQIIDFSNTLVIHDGKAYRPEGMKMIGTAPGTLWLLCHRSKADDPAP